MTLPPSTVVASIDRVDSQTIVALAGITATAIVGVASVTVNWLLQGGRQRHERELADLSELRGVLDDATTKLGAAIDARVGLASAFDPDPFLDALGLVVVCEKRIQTRLGNVHPVAAAYHRCRVLLFDQAHSQKQGLEGVEIDPGEQETLRVSERQARERYYEEASKLVGSQLPG